MRSLIPALAVAAFAAPAFAADPAEGLWLVQSGSAKVRIGPCAGRADRLCGAIAWVRDPKQAVAHDERNPDPALRARPIMGLLMIRDFKAAGSGRWTGGKIYDPETGKTYDSKLKVERDGTLKVEGCILMICKAQTWRRS
jgi:uncharacterized protein (DUF2147 family)